jgi:hypothetical protein
MSSRLMFVFDVLTIIAAVILYSVGMFALALVPEIAPVVYAVSTVSGVGLGMSVSDLARRL